tara:strand:- start:787 stop:3606 length:2820 start_codon:yes stop_codon:yes gene_type:complete
MAPRYRSGRLFQQFIGVTDYTDERLVLDVIGNARISGILTVPQLYVTGVAGEITGDLSARNLNIIGITTLGGPLSIGNTYGSNGQFLKSTGNGLEWASFPEVRSASTFTATAGQTDFAFSYNINYIDVYVNGVKLSLTEYTATTGSLVVLNTGCFAGDLVELVSFNATSIGGTGNTGGSGGSTTGINTVGRSYFNHILATGIVTATQGFFGDITGDLTGTASTATSAGTAYAIEGTPDINARRFTADSVNVSTAVTANRFYGDGSNLTGVIAAGSGVVIQEEGSPVGTAGTINFVGAAYTASVIDGVAKIDLGSHYSSIAGLATVATNALGLTGSPNITVGGISANGINVGVVTSTSLDINGDADVSGNLNVTGIITANTFSGPATQALQVDITSNNFADETCYITFVDGASGYQTLESDTGLSFNPASSALTASVFNGQLNGNALTATTSTDAQNLIGTPDITVRRVVADSVQVATAVTATAFYGTLVGSIQGGNISAYSASFASDVSIGGTLTYEDVRNVDSVGLITARSGIVIGPSVGIAATITDTGNGTFAGIVSATSFVGDGSQLTGIAAGANVSISDSAPSGPVIGDLWWKSDEGVLKVYYTDVDSSQWIDASPGGQGGSGGGGGGTLNNLVEDASPQLGYDLDANTYGIFNAGIITATYFFGGGLGIGINTVGGNAGYGITTIDFRGSGISTVTTPDAGISTVYLEGGGANVTTSDIAPTSAGDGDLWWNSSVGALKVYYDDGDSQQWVDAAGTQGALSGSYVYDMYSLSGQTTANAMSDSTIGSGNLFGGTWARPGAPFANQGDGIGESSGIFSFPSIGFYKIKALLQMRNDASGSNWNAKMNLQYTNDGGTSWQSLCEWWDLLSAGASGSNLYRHPSIDHALNITDTAQQKVRLSFDSDSQNVYFMNSAIGGFLNDAPRSTITFEKVIQS